jgi:hypothetical protein
MTEENEPMHDQLLVAFYADMRYGSVEGLFVTTEPELLAAYGKVAYLGEILGKHSEVIYTIDPTDFRIVSRDQKLIGMITNEFESHDLSGINPLGYDLDSDE